MMDLCAIVMHLLQMEVNTCFSQNNLMTIRTLDKIPESFVDVFHVPANMKRPKYCIFCGCLIEKLYPT